MENIIVHAFIQCKPGTGAEAAKVMRESGLLPLVREEDGNMHYELFTSIDDPDRLAFMEVWENAPKLKVHAESERMKQINALLGAYAVDVKLNKYLP